MDSEGFVDKLLRFSLVVAIAYLGHVRNFR